MATVTKPLALDESINTTEQTPRNIADVLAEELSAIEQAIAGGSGSGGHVIEDTNGTTLAQRADLQFVGVYTEDDSANDRTKVNVVRTMTKAQMDALSAAEKVGFIRTSDEADNPYQGLAPINFYDDVVFTDTPTSSVQFVKCGRHINIVFQGASRAHTANEVLFTLPSYARPSVELNFTGRIGVIAYCNIQINPSNGQVILTGASDMTAVNRAYVTASYYV